MTTRGRTTAEVAARIGRDPGWAAALLEQEQRRGLVECGADGLWRATPAAVARYGAIRWMGAPSEVEARPRS